LSIRKAGWLAVPALALLIWLIYGSGYVDYDALYALIWGDDLAELHRPPDMGATHSPTPHPLHTLVSMPLSFLGSGALDGLEALSVLSFAALAWFAFLLGKRLFGSVAGVVLAITLLIRPVLVNQALTANIDVPFLAFVLGAMAMEAKQPRRGWPVLALLALAGLLRPEAWLLSIAYVIWLMWDDRDPRAHAREIGLALSAPVAWTLFDLVLTGNPVHSLTHTSDAATRIGRPQGPVRAVRLTPGYLADYLTVPVVLAGVAAAVAAIALRVRRAYLPIVLGLLSGLGFLFLGFADLPLLARYLAVPSAMLALLVAGAVAAPWWWPGDRAPAIAASVLAALALIVSIPLSSDELSDKVNAAKDRHEVDQALPGFLDRPAVARAIDRCRPLQTQFFQTRPLAAYLIERRPNQIDTGRPERATVGAVLTSSLDRSQAPPPGFAVVSRSDHWILHQACR
jgi:hypothetical protein